MTRLEPRQDDLTPCEALGILLDQVDYTAGACQPTEMVGGVLDASVIEKCRRAKQLWEQDIAEFPVRRRAQC